MRSRNRLGAQGRKDSPRTAILGNATHFAEKEFVISSRSRGWVRFFATFRCIYGAGARKYWLNMVLERY
jgi:hypothetical protein